MTRVYGQYCPIATALDVLGERWTLLILRELLGGPRRYADLRAQLPGIATNLLSERLRHLVTEGLVERHDVPPPISRTLYRLSDAGWRHVPPVIGALAAYGAERMPYEPDQTSPLTGFLIGVLAGFDAHRARHVDEDYRVIVDDRPFDIGVRHGELCGGGRDPAVQVRGRAGDLLERRLRPSAARAVGAVGAASAARLEFTGRPAATARFQSVFGLTPPDEAAG
jgi:DNA-binding HxlR family transcriptional regulator